MHVDSPRSAAVSSEPSSAATLGAETSSVAPAIDRGAAIGRYVVLHRVGAGGMGVVYAAYDPELDRKVALKVLRGDGSSDSARPRARLLREAQSMARLNHPAVVTVHDVGTFEGRVFVAMEFVDGETLRAWVTTPRRWHEVLPVLLAVGRGLAAAHAVGLVHRDVKPDNVMIARDGRALLMDFGLVRALSEVSSVDASAGTDVDDRALATRDGATIGTPGYIAPEVLGGSKADAAADQFAFAVMAWEVLFGERPFSGHTALELAASTLGGQVGRGTTRDVPAWLRRVLRRSLELAPQARFPTMDALLEELGRNRTRARRRVVAMAGLAIVGVGAWGAVHLDRAAKISACDGEAARIHGHWDTARGETVADALRATAVSYAETAATKVQAVLDDYAGAWESVARDACIAHRVAGTRTDDLDARATSCLDERLLALDQLAATLAEPDAKSVQSAVVSALQLPAIDGCTDEQALLRQPALPDAATRQLGAPLQAALAKVAALELTGHSSEAVELAAITREDAVAIDWPALHALVAFREGYSAERSGDVARAETRLFEAWLLAGGIEADELALDIASALAQATAFGAGDLARGWQWHAQAQMIATRLDLGDDTLRRARLLQLEARLADRSGERERARAADERALAIYEQTVGPDHMFCAAPLGGLARDAALRGDFDRAIALHGRALELRLAALGPTHPDVGLSHANLGNAYGMRHDSAAAERHHRIALEIFIAARGADHPDAAVLRTNLANDLVALGRGDEAEAELRSAIVIIERARGAEHPDTALPLFNLGTMLIGRHAFEESLPELRRAHAIWAGRLGAEHPNTARALTAIGESELALGRLAPARDALVPAVEAFEKPDAPPADLAIARFALARLRWLEGDRDAAKQLVTLARDAVATLEGSEDTRKEIARWLRDVGLAP